MHTSNALILLIVVATAVSLATRRIGVPYTVGLVVVGLLLGMLHLIPAPQLDKDLLFEVFLPGLVFEAAYHVRSSDVRADAVPIIALAVPGVVVSLVLTALLVVTSSTLIPPVPTVAWPHALVFGALIASTDPVAVVSIFRSLGVPQRLTTLLESESLLNDGTAIVFFGLTLALATGGAFETVPFLLDFLRVVVIGVAVGAGLGWIMSVVTRRIDDPVIEITFTVIAAYGSFALADYLGGSGVIATVVAGVMIGNLGARIGMSPATRRAVESFWSYIAFLLNSIIFLLIGFAVNLHNLLSSLPLVLLALLVVLVARLIMVTAVVTGGFRARAPIPARWIVPLTWGGLRGAVSMVLALALPEDFPGRERIISVTFGVVLLSIVLQGMTMGPLLRWLGLQMPVVTGEVVDGGVAPHPVVSSPSERGRPWM